MRLAIRLVPLAGDLIPIGLVSRLSVGVVVSVLIGVVPLPALPLLILVLSISVLGVFPLGVVLVVSPTVFLLSLGGRARLLSSSLLPLDFFLLCFLPLSPFLLDPFPLSFFLLGSFLLWLLEIRRCLWQIG